MTEMQFYLDVHLLYAQKYIFPEELNMHSIGALVKAIGASQNTHFHNNTEKFARLLILSSLKTELIRILHGYTYSLEKIM